MGNPLRLSAGLLLLLLVLGPPAARAEPEEELEDPRALAEAFLARKDAQGQDEALAWLEKEGHDPWILAEGLLLTGEREIARAIAGVREADDAGSLQIYVSRESDAPAELDGAVREAAEMLRAGESQEALQRLDSVRPAPRTVSEIRAQWLRTRALRALGREEDADRSLETAAECAESIGWGRLELEARARLFERIPEDQDHVRQRRHLRRLVQLDERGDDLGRSALWCARLGLLERELNRPRRARSLLLEATGLFDALVEGPGLSEELGLERLVALAKLASVHYELGESAEALEAATRANELASSFSPVLQVETKTVLARAYMQFGRHDIAKPFLEKAVEMSETVAPVWYPGLQGELAQLHVRMGEVAEARNLYRKVLAAYQAREDRTRECITRVHIASADLADVDPAGRTVRLEGVADEMVKLLRELEEDEEQKIGERAEIEISARTFAGEAYERLGRFEDAEFQLRLAMDHPLARDVPVWQRLSRLRLARCLRRQGKVEEAARLLQATLRELKAGIPFLPTWLALSRLARPDTKELVEECLAVARAHSGIDLERSLESTRGILYLVEVWLRSLEDAGLGGTPDLLSGSTLRKQVAAAAMEYWRAQADGDREILEAAERRLWKQRLQLRKEQERASLASVESDRAEPSPDDTFPFEDPVPALRQDDAFLYYAACEDEVFVAAVVHERMRDWTIGKRSDIDARVRNAMSAWQTDDADYETETGDLVEKLFPADLLVYLGFVEDGTGEPPNHVYVSASGTLASLPWSMLLEQACLASVKPPRRLPTVTHVASQAVLSCIAESNAAYRGGPLLALGDPDYLTAQGETDRGLAFGPSLPRLRFSAKAVDAIVHDERRDVKLLGKDACVEELKKNLFSPRRRFGALHLSCHGRLHQSSPMLSGLALHAKGDDGLLSVEEVGRWRFRRGPRLVVLAACESGLGTPVPGEGEEGLVRAFLLAGARHVVASLWSVDDESTSTLMVSFYRHLRDEGMAPAAALQAAQHEVRDANEGKTAHPFHWAGWEVWGPRD